MHCCRKKKRWWCGGHGVLTKIKPSRSEKAVAGSHLMYWSILIPVYPLFYPVMLLTSWWGKACQITYHTLTATEKYSQLDKEALAMVFGVEKYHSYLFGQQFILKTYLIHIFKETRATPNLASGRILRWVLILCAYRYAIQYKAGKENFKVDALSGLPAPTSQKECRCTESTSSTNFTEEAQSKLCI